MTAVTVRQTDGTPVTFDDVPLNQGGEKTVFPSRDRRHVVAFFHGRMRDRTERVDRLSRILTSYNPTLGVQGTYWEPYFCWPSGMVDGDGVPPRFATAHGLTWPALGVVAPIYRSCFYFTDRFGHKQEKEVKWFTGRKAAALVPEAERGTWLTRLQVCTRLARAVRRMHFAGLAHSDLSNKNVLVDPLHGDACVIDIDSLVVPSVAPPSVLGTPGYIAPEVLAGKAQPSILTDKHALAVLLYQLLLHRHPLQGRQVHSVRSAEYDEVLSMGARALFVEHPTDPRNPSVVPLRVPYTRLGPFLSVLFERAFIHGLHTPSKRPDAAEWEKALYATLQLLYPAPSGRDWTLLGPGLPFDAPLTGEPLTEPVLFARFCREADGHLREEAEWLVLWHHLTLHAWHCSSRHSPNEHADRTPRGYVARHRGAWWFVNTSGASMQIVGQGTLANKESVALAPGLVLRLGEDADARLVRIHQMQGAQ